eukprot:2592048-Rhodomonas_salina.1
MALHPSHVGVQDAGCGTLGHLCVNDVDKDRIGQVGGIEVAVAAMQRNAGVDRVQLAGAGSQPEPVVLQVSRSTALDVQSADICIPRDRLRAAADPGHVRGEPGQDRSEGRRERAARRAAAASQSAGQRDPRQQGRVQRSEPVGGAEREAGGVDREGARGSEEPRGE